MARKAEVAHVRLTPLEAKKYRTLAERLGMTLSGWIRMVLRLAAEKNDAPSDR